MKTNKKQNLFATILSVILLVAFFAISALLNLGPAAKNTVATNSDRKSGTFLLSDSDDEMPKPVENPPATILVSVQNGTSGYADSNGHPIYYSETYGIVYCDQSDKEQTGAKFYTKFVDGNYSVDDEISVSADALHEFNENILDVNGHETYYNNTRTQIIYCDKTNKNVDGAKFYSTISDAGVYSNVITISDKSTLINQTYINNSSAVMNQIQAQIDNGDVYMVKDVKRDGSLDNNIVYTNSNAITINGITINGGSNIYSNGEYYFFYYNINEQNVNNNTYTALNPAYISGTNTIDHFYIGTDTTNRINILDTNGKAQVERVYINVNYVQTITNDNNNSIPLKNAAEVYGTIPSGYSYSFVTDANSEHVLTAGEIYIFREIQVEKIAESADKLKGYHLDGNDYYRVYESFENIISGKYEANKTYFALENGSYVQLTAGIDYAIGNSITANNIYVKTYWYFDGYSAKPVTTGSFYLAKTKSTDELFQVAEKITATQKAYVLGDMTNWSLAPLNKDGDNWRVLINGSFADGQLTKESGYTYVYSKNDTFYYINTNGDGTYYRLTTKTDTPASTQIAETLNASYFSNHYYLLSDGTSRQYISYADYLDATKTVELDIEILDGGYSTTHLPANFLAAYLTADNYFVSDKEYTSGNIYFSFDKFTKITYRGETRYYFTYANLEVFQNFYTNLYYIKEGTTKTGLSKFEFNNNQVVVTRDGYAEDFEFYYDKDGIEYVAPTNSTFFYNYYIQNGDAYTGINASDVSLFEHYITPTHFFTDSNNVKHFFYISNGLYFNVDSGLLRLTLVEEKDDASAGSIYKNGTTYEYFDGTPWVTLNSNTSYRVYLSPADNSISTEVRDDYEKSNKSKITQNTQDQNNTKLNISIGEFGNKITGPDSIEFYVYKDGEIYLQRSGNVLIYGSGEKYYPIKDYLTLVTDKTNANANSIYYNGTTYEWFDGTTWAPLTQDPLDTNRYFLSNPATGGSNLKTTNEFTLPAGTYTLSRGFAENLGITLTIYYDGNDRVYVQNTDDDKTFTLNDEKNVKIRLFYYNAHDYNHLVVTPKLYDSSGVNLIGYGTDHEFQDLNSESNNTEFIDNKDGTITINTVDKHFYIKTITDEQTNEKVLQKGYLYTDINKHIGGSSTSGYYFGVDIPLADMFGRWEVLVACKKENGEIVATNHGYMVNGQSYYTYLTFGLVRESEYYVADTVPTMKNATGVDTKIVTENYYNYSYIANELPNIVFDTTKFRVDVTFTPINSGTSTTYSISRKNASNIDVSKNGTTSKEDGYSLADSTALAKKFTFYLTDLGYYQVTYTPIQKNADASYSDLILSNSDTFQNHFNLTNFGYQLQYTQYSASNPTRKNFFAYAGVLNTTGELTTSGVITLDDLFAGSKNQEQTLESEIVKLDKHSNVDILQDVEGYYFNYNNQGKFYKLTKDQNNATHYTYTGENDSITYFVIDSENDSYYITDSTYTAQTTALTLVTEKTGASANSIYFNGTTYEYFDGSEWRNLIEQTTHYTYTASTTITYFVIDSENDSYYITDSTYTAQTTALTYANFTSILNSAVSSNQAPATFINTFSANGSNLTGYFKSNVTGTWEEISKRPTDFFSEAGDYIIVASYTAPNTSIGGEFTQCFAFTLTNSQAEYTLSAINQIFEENGSYQWFDGSAWRDLTKVSDYNYRYTYTDGTNTICFYINDNTETYYITPELIVVTETTGASANSIYFNTETGKYEYTADGTNWVELTNVSGTHYTYTDENESITYFVIDSENESYYIADSEYQETKTTLYKTTIKDVNIQSGSITNGNVLLKLNEKASQFDVKPQILIQFSGEDYKGSSVYTGEGYGITHDGELVPESTGYLQNCNKVTFTQSRSYTVTLYYGPTVWGDKATFVTWSFSIDNNKITYSPRENSAELSDETEIIGGIGNYFSLYAGDSIVGNDAGTKASGAAISVKYRYTPINPNNVTSNKLTDSNDLIYITTHYVLDFSKTSTFANYELGSEKSCELAGLYEFIITDAAGNSASYFIFLDNVKPEYVVEDLSSDASAPRYSVTWGDYKAIWANNPAYEYFNGTTWVTLTRVFGTTTHFIYTDNTNTMYFVIDSENENYYITDNTFTAQTTALNLVSDKTGASANSIYYNDSYSAPTKNNKAHNESEKISASVVKGIDGQNYLVNSVSDFEVRFYPDGEKASNNAATARDSISGRIGYPKADGIYTFIYTSASYAFSTEERINGEWYKYLEITKTGFTILKTKRNEGQFIAFATDSVNNIGANTSKKFSFDLSETTIYVKNNGESASFYQNGYPSLVNDTSSNLDYLFLTAITEGSTDYGDWKLDSIEINFYELVYGTDVYSHVAKRVAVFDSETNDLSTLTPEEIIRVINENTNGNSKDGKYVITRKYAAGFQAPPDLFEAMIENGHAVETTGLYYKANDTWYTKNADGFAEITDSDEIGRLNDIQELQPTGASIGQYAIYEAILKFDSERNEYYYTKISDGTKAYTVGSKKGIATDDEEKTWTVYIDRILPIDRNAEYYNYISDSSYSEKRTVLTLVTENTGASANSIYYNGTTYEYFDGTTWVTLTNVSGTHYTYTDENNNVTYFVINEKHYVGEENNLELQPSGENLAFNEFVFDGNTVSLDTNLLPAMLDFLANKYGLTSNPYAFFNLFVSIEQWDGNKYLTVQSKIAVDSNVIKELELSEGQFRITLSDAVSSTISDAAGSTLPANSVAFVFKLTKRAPEAKFEAIKTIDFVSTTNSGCIYKNSVNSYSYADTMMSYSLERFDDNPNHYKFNNVYCYINEETNEFYRATDSTYSKKWYDLTYISEDTVIYDQAGRFSLFVKELKYASVSVNLEKLKDNYYKLINAEYYIYIDLQNKIAYRTTSDFTTPYNPETYTTVVLDGETNFVSVKTGKATTFVIEDPIDFYQAKVDGEKIKLIYSNGTIENLTDSTAISVQKHVFSETEQGNYPEGKPRYYYTVTLTTTVEDVYGFTIQFKGDSSLYGNYYKAIYTCVVDETKPTYNENTLINSDKDHGNYIAEAGLINAYITDSTYSKKTTKLTFVFTKTDATANSIYYNGTTYEYFNGTIWVTLTKVSETKYTYKKNGQTITYFYINNNKTERSFADYPFYMSRSDIFGKATIVESAGRVNFENLLKSIYVENNYSDKLAKLDTYKIFLRKVEATGDYSNPSIIPNDGDVVPAGNTSPIFSGFAGVEYYEFEFGTRISDAITGAGFTSSSNIQVFEIIEVDAAGNYQSYFVFYQPWANAISITASYQNYFTELGEANYPTLSTHTGTFANGGEINAVPTYTTSNNKTAINNLSVTSINSINKYLKVQINDNDAVYLTPNDNFSDFVLNNIPSSGSYIIKIFDKSLNNISESKNYCTITINIADDSKTIYFVIDSTTGKYYITDSTYTDDKSKITMLTFVTKKDGARANSIYFNTKTNEYEYFDGSTWVSIKLITSSKTHYVYTNRIEFIKAENDNDVIHATYNAYTFNNDNSLKVTKIEINGSRISTSDLLIDETDGTAKYFAHVYKEATDYRLEAADNIAYIFSSVDNFGRKTVNIISKNEITTPAFYSGEQKLDEGKEAGLELTFRIDLLIYNALSNADITAGELSFNFRIENSEQIVTFSYRPNINTEITINATRRDGAVESYSATQNTVVETPVFRKPNGNTLTSTRADELGWKWNVELSTGISIHLNDIEKYNANLTYTDENGNIQTFKKIFSGTTIKTYTAAGDYTLIVFSDNGAEIEYSFTVVNASESFFYVRSANGAVLKPSFVDYVDTNTSPSTTYVQYFVNNSGFSIILSDAFEIAFLDVNGNIYKKQTDGSIITEGTTAESFESDTNYWLFHIKSVDGAAVQFEKFVKVNLADSVTTSVYQDGGLVTSSEILTNKATTISFNNNVESGNYLTAYVYYKSQTNLTAIYAPASTSNTKTSILFNAPGVFYVEIVDLAGNVVAFENYNFLTIYNLSEITATTKSGENDISLMNGLVITPGTQIVVDNFSKLNSVKFSIVKDGKEILTSDDTTLIISEQGNILTLLQTGVYEITISGFVGVGSTMEVTAVYRIFVINPESARLGFEYFLPENYTITNVYQSAIGSSERTAYTDYSKNKLALSYAKGGNSHYLVEVETDFGDVRGKENFSFEITIANNTPVISSNVNFAETTTKTINLSFNARDIYLQQGACQIRIINRADGSMQSTPINASSADATQVISISSEGVYDIQVWSESGETLFYWTSVGYKTPLNTVAIILIVIASVVAATGVILFIVLRTKMKVR